MYASTRARVFERHVLGVLLWEVSTAGLLLDGCPMQGPALALHILAADARSRMYLMHKHHVGCACVCACTDEDTNACPTLVGQR